MPVIPFPSGRGFNSATFIRRHIVLSTIRKFSNLHLKNQKKYFFLFFFHLIDKLRYVCL